jgi:hypothetical protein
MLKNLKYFKYFMFGVKVLIPLSFFALANIDRVTALSQTGMNAIAGVMTILTLAMYGLDYMFTDKSGKDIKALQAENEFLANKVKSLEKKGK